MIRELFFTSFKTFIFCYHGNSVTILPVGIPVATDYTILHEIEDVW